MSNPSLNSANHCSHIHASCCELTLHFPQTASKPQHVGAIQQTIVRPHTIPRRLRVNLARMSFSRISYCRCSIRWPSVNRCSRENFPILGDSTYCKDSLTNQNAERKSHRNQRLSCWAWWISSDQSGDGDCRLSLREREVFSRSEKRLPPEQQIQIDHETHY